MIVWGTRLFGKVDEVPGLFHVATQFFHVWYVPLIPLGTHLVFEEGGEGWQGLPVRLSLKSVTVAWVRGFAAAGAIVFGLIGLTEGSGWNPTLTRALVCAALFALLKFYRGFRRASYERAVELAEEADLPPSARIMLDVEYGVLDAEQAEQALLALAPDEDADKEALPPDDA
jgi:4-amino-4-deoxy-L-arabinose transferase-like glycosyltransferase